MIIIILNNILNLWKLKFNFSQSANARELHSCCAEHRLQSFRFRVQKVQRNCARKGEKRTSSSHGLH